MVPEPDFVLVLPSWQLVPHFQNTFRAWNARKEHQRTQFTTWLALGVHLIVTILPAAPRSNIHNTRCLDVFSS